jgi:hypothetical protein
MAEESPAEKSPDYPIHPLRESGAHYVVDAQGQPVAVLLTLDEYDRYLDLLDDEADSQDGELASRLEQAATSPADNERTSFREYLTQRESLDDQEVQS